MMPPRRLFIVVQSATMPRAQAARMATLLQARMFDAPRSPTAWRRLRRALNIAKRDGSKPVVWWEREPLRVPARLRPRLNAMAAGVRLVAITGPRGALGVWRGVPWLAPLTKDRERLAVWLAARAAQQAQKGHSLSP